MQKLTGRHTSTETGRSDAGKLRATGMSGLPVFKRQDVGQGWVATQKDSLGPAGLRSHRTNGHTPGTNGPRHGAPLPTGITLHDLIRRSKYQAARYALRMQAHWCQSLDAIFWESICIDDAGSGLPNVIAFSRRRKLKLQIHLVLCIWNLNRSLAAFCHPIPWVKFKYIPHGIRRRLSICSYQQSITTTVPSNFPVTVQNSFFLPVSRSLAALFASSKST